MSAPHSQRADGWPSDFGDGAAQGESAYELFQEGVELLKSRDGLAARAPLERAKQLQPNKPSIAEALGRAYFYAGEYAKAAVEFKGVVERNPIDDYAQFCLGRSLQKLGRIVAARQHFAMAAELRPDRSDYRRYRLMLSTS